MIHLDTHVAAWLYAGRVDLLSGRASRLLEERDLAVSPMVVLELEYLHEVGRLLVGGHEVLQSLRADIGLQVDDHGFERVVEAARSASWTRDPFDRLIVGHADAASRELLTRDETIRRHFDAATW